MYKERIISAFAFTLKIEDFYSYRISDALLGKSAGQLWPKSVLSSQGDEEMNQKQYKLANWGGGDLCR